MNILITGGAGFLGTHIALELVNRGDSVTVFENQASVYPWGLEALDKKVQIVFGDILDQKQLEAVLTKFRIDKVIHAAAIVGARQALGLEKKVAEVNVLGTINVLEAIRNTNVKTCIHITSEEVYGNFICSPADEKHPPGPLSPYGITKYTAEAFSSYYRTRYGVNVSSVRTSWVSGPGLPRDRIPRNFIKSALATGRIESASGAAMSIDFVYIDDFVQGVLLALDCESLSFDVYNIASGKEYTILEIARMIADLIPGTEVNIGPGLLQTPEGLLMPQKGALDISRAKRELGYQPKYSIKEALEKYIEYLRHHEY